MNKSAKINVRDDAEIVKAFREAVKKNHESISTVIRRYVRNYIKRAK